MTMIILSSFVGMCATCWDTVGWRVTTTTLWFYSAQMVFLPASRNTQSDCDNYSRGENTITRWGWLLCLSFLAFRHQPWHQKRSWSRPPRARCEVSGWTRIKVSTTIPSEASDMPNHLSKNWDSKWVIFNISFLGMCGISNFLKGLSRQKGTLGTRCRNWCLLSGLFCSFSWVTDNTQVFVMWYFQGVHKKPEKKHKADHKDCDVLRKRPF